MQHRPTRNSFTTYLRLQNPNSASNEIEECRNTGLGNAQDFVSKSIPAAGKHMSPAPYTMFLHVYHVLGPDDIGPAASRRKSLNQYLHGLTHSSRTISIKTVACKLD